MKVKQPVPAVKTDRCAHLVMLWIEQTRLNLSNRDYWQTFNRPVKEVVANLLDELEELLEDEV